MSHRCPAEQRERATRMALERLDEYGSAWAVAQALGPTLGAGAESLRRWVLQALSGRPPTHLAWRAGARTVPAVPLFLGEDEGRGGHFQGCKDVSD
jgi:hypothetical protein